jgi:hypothetical protein
MLHSGAARGEGELGFHSILGAGCKKQATAQQRTGRPSTTREVSQFSPGNTLIERDACTLECTAYNLRDGARSRE